jgi:hypothetical protein
MGTERAPIFTGKKQKRPDPNSAAADYGTLDLFEILQSYSQATYSVMIAWKAR